MADKPPFVGEKSSCTLSDIALVKAGNVAPKSRYFSDSGIPFVRAGSLSALVAGNPTSSLEKIAPDIAQDLGMRLFPKGTVLFAKSGMSCMTGNVYRLPEPCYVVSHLACVTTEDELLSQWLLHFFRYNRPSSLIENPSFPSIKLSRLSSIEVILPNQKEMLREVQALSAIEEQNELYKEQMKKLDQLIKSRFVEMFGDPIKSERHPSAMLGDLYEVKSSKRIYAREHTKEGVPFYRLADVGSLIDGESPRQELFISTERYEELKKSGMVPVTNDVLVTARGTLGKCYVIKDADEFYFQDGMITWLSQTEYSPLATWLVELFANQAFASDLNKNCSGTTVKYLSINDLINKRIPIPPIELQQEFADFVHQVDKSRFVVQEQIEKLQTLYDSLAQEYFGD